jgi:outer membrane protein TolC
MRFGTYGAASLAMLFAASAVADPRPVRISDERAVAPALPAADGVPLTLEQARGLALANNKKLQLGRMNVQEKQIAARAAFKDYFPKILGSATFLHFNDPLGTVVATNGRQLGGATIGPGGVIQVPTINIPSRTITANVVNQNAAFGTVLVAQPITKLIGVSALVDVAEADSQIAAEQLDQGTRDLLSGVSQAYYGLLAAEQIEQVLSLQLSALAPLLGGKVSPEIRLGVLELRKGRAEARKQKEEVADLLNQLIGYPTGVRLQVAEPVLPTLAVGSADEAAQYAVSNSPQIREAQQSILKAEAGLRAAKMEYLPDVNVVGGYVGQTAADYIQPNFATVGVMGSYTFWDWGKRRNLKDQREMQIILARQNVATVTDTVELEARKAFQAYEQAVEDLEIAEETVAARQDGEGDAKAPADVMAAKGATARAQLDLMQARLNYRLAHAKLCAAIGQ